MKTIITLLAFISFSLPALALRPVAVKGNRTLVDLEGENLSAGDRLAARTHDGRTRALLEVKQVKNGRAVADVVKGRMSMDLNLVLAGSTGSGKSARSSGRSGGGKSAWGFTAGMANNAMTVKLTSASVSLAGSSFNVSGFYQPHIDGNFSARVLVGYETLQATGTSTVCASSECKVNISYLGIETVVRYSFVRNQTMDVWLGAGLGFLFAVGKDSNILDTSKISTNQTIVGSLGLDYKLSRTSFVPVQFDYAMFPDNAASSAKQMILRVGYGTSF